MMRLLLVFMATFLVLVMAGPNNARAGASHPEDVHCQVLTNSNQREFKQTIKVQGTWLIMWKPDGGWGAAAKQCNRDVPACGGKCLACNGKEFGECYDEKGHCYGAHCNDV